MYAEERKEAFAAIEQTRTRISFHFQLESVRDVIKSLLKQLARAKEKTEGEMKKCIIPARDKAEFKQYIRIYIYENSNLSNLNL